MATTGQQPIQSNAAEIAVLTQLSVAFQDDTLPLTIIAGTSGEHLVLPESLFRTLQEAIGYLLRGDAVAISPLHRYLTTTEAGDLLGVSRQYLTRLIDAGQIRHELVGRHRRIVLRDLLEYRARRSRERRSALAELTRQDAADGAYD